MSLTDTLMSAFAMFSLQSPPLLAFDQERTEGQVAAVEQAGRVTVIKPSPGGRGDTGA